MRLFTPGSYHTVYISPFGNTAQVVVVDVHIGDHFGCTPGEQGVFGRIVVDRIEIQTPVMAKSHSLLQQFSFSGSPKDKPVAFGLEELERIDGKRPFPADFRVLMLNDGPVKIYGDNHFLKSFWSHVFFLRLSSSP